MNFKPIIIKEFYICWFINFYNPFHHLYEDFLFRSCQSSQHTGHIQITWTPGLGWGVIHPWKFLCIQGIFFRRWSLQTLFFMFASLYLNSLSFKVGNKVLKGFFSIVIRFNDEKFKFFFMLYSYVCWLTTSFFHLAGVGRLEENLISLLMYWGIIKE